jgi:hypothetical protein
LALWAVLAKGRSFDSDHVPVKPPVEGFPEGSAKYRIEDLPFC